MRVVLTAGEREQITDALALHDANSDDALDAIDAAVAMVLPWLPYWWDGMSYDQALRTLLAHAEVEG